MRIDKHISSKSITFVSVCHELKLKFHQFSKEVNYIDEMGSGRKPNEKNHLH